MLLERNREAGGREGRAAEAQRSGRASLGWALHSVLRSLNFLLQTMRSHWCFREITMADVSRVGLTGTGSEAERSQETVTIVSRN